MKKYSRLSIGLLLCLSSATTQAADDFLSMFTEGKVSGQIREFSLSRSIKLSAPGSDDYTRMAHAIGGHLKFETSPYEGFSFGTAFYTTNGFGLKSNKKDKRVDPSLLGNNNHSYALLGEAYLKFKYANTTFKGGRQKLSSPFAGTDDARMLPNLFEAVVLKNTDLADTTLQVGHLTKFAQGTFGRVYGTGGILGATAGYSAVDASTHAGEFENMGNYAVGKSTDGVTFASATYTGIDGLKVQLWDYYAHDIMNAFYMGAFYKPQIGLINPYIAAQFIKQDDVGDQNLSELGGNGELDSYYWGAKVGTTIENFNTYVAYSQNSRNSDADVANGAYQNATLSFWGGMPQFTQGMVTRHAFLAGTKAVKVSASYNFQSFGPDLTAAYYFTHYDMHKNNGYTHGDASEMGFDIIYNTSFIQNLQLRFRGNFTDDFKVKANGDKVQWNEFRFIANYSF